MNFHVGITRLAEPAPARLRLPKGVRGGALSARKTPTSETGQFQPRQGRALARARVSHTTRSGGGVSHAGQREVAHGAQRSGRRG